LLTQDANDILDCRLVEAPTIEIELVGGNLTIYPETYMRRLPLREGVSVGSAKGVSMTAAAAKPVGGDQAETDKVLLTQNPNVNVTSGVASSSTGNGFLPNDAETKAKETVSQEAELLPQVRRHCRPKMMPVSMPEPLGPKLFILGEPVLHRYYSVYDWSNPRIGFGLSSSRRNREGPLAFREGADRRGSLPEGMDTILMQQRLTMDSVSSSDADSVGWTDEDVASGDTLQFSQVTVSIGLSVRPRRVGSLKNLPRDMISEATRGEWSDSI
jgi:hypothetical protein